MLSIYQPRSFSFSDIEVFSGMLAIQVELEYNTIQAVLKYVYVAS